MFCFLKWFPVNGRAKYLAVFQQNVARGRRFYFMDFCCRKRMFQFKVCLSCTKFSNVTCLVYNLNQVLPAEPNFVVLQTPEGNAPIFFLFMLQNFWITNALGPDGDVHFFLRTRARERWSWSQKGQTSSNWTIRDYHSGFSNSDLVHCTTFIQHRVQNILSTTTVWTWQAITTSVWVHYCHPQYPWVIPQQKQAMSRVDWSL